MGALVPKCSETLGKQASKKARGLSLGHWVSIEEEDHARVGGWVVKCSETFGRQARGLGFGHWVPVEEKDHGRVGRWVLRGGKQESMLECKGTRFWALRTCRD
jgi:hypothetical protein